MEAQNQRKLGHEDRSDHAVTADRVRAWGLELRRVHQDFRRQIDELRAGEPPAGKPRENTRANRAESRANRTEAHANARPAPEPRAQSLSAFCVGFCESLGRHHTAEDGGLFPRITAEHPELGPVIDRLMEDHALLNHLLTDLEALPPDAEPAERNRHLDGVAAIMESHFTYEERTLVAVLNTMTTDDANIKNLMGYD